MPVPLFLERNWLVSGLLPKWLYSLFKKENKKSKSSTFFPFLASDKSQMSFKALRLQKGGKLRALGCGPESAILGHQLLGEQARPRGAGQRPCSPVTLLVWGPPEPGEGHAHCTNQNPLGSNEGWKSRQESWSKARPKTWEWPGLKPSSATSRPHDPSQTTSALNLFPHL